MPTTNTAHDGDYQAERFLSDPERPILALWREPHPPEPLDANGLPAGRYMRNADACWRCWYCGSMPPDQLAEAIAAGATVSWADRKYGWPHKVYVEGIPNPYAGLPEIRSSRSTGRRPSDEEIEDSKNDPHMGPWHEFQNGFDEHTGKPKMGWRRLGKPTPAAARERGKFYTVHLKDATPEQRLVIERAMGISFNFTSDGKVSWEPFVEPAAA